MTVSDLMYALYVVVWWVQRDHARYWSDSVDR